MYLKSIQLSGFKSFAEPTEIILEPGITAIVGPNGCGKSNTVDAIRWCLGELSPKMLRSKSTTDVIFNGTRRLSPAACSQVTLVFDNTDRALHFDASEVSVTRKAYRDGASEYFINKSSCRLKDIRNLFAGTGLGDDGYSIMEHSMVDFLLTAKPADRRSLFDEASGAARFGSQRNEATSRLNRIVQDLDRVRDEIEFMSAERRRIESQARKARLHDRLAVQQKDLQTRRVVRDWESVNAKESSIRNERLAPAQKDLENRILERDQKYAQNETVKVRQIELSLLAQSASEKYHEALRVRDITTERLRHLESRLAEHEKNRQTITHEIHLFTERVNSGESELIRISGDVASQETQCQQYQTELESAKMQGELSQELHDRREALTVQLQELKSRMTEESRQLTDERNRSLALVTEMTHLQAELKSSLKEHQKIDAEKISWQEAGQEALSRQEVLAQEVSQLEQKISLVDTAHQDLISRQRSVEEALYRHLSSERAALEARLKQWEKESSQDAYVRGAKSIISDLSELAGVSGPIGRHINCQSHHVAVLKDLFGEKLNWFVADNIECATAAIRRLESSSKGRAVFVLRDRVEEWLRHRAGSSNLLGVPQGSAWADLNHLIEQTEESWRTIALFLAGPSYAQGDMVFGEAFVRGGERLDSSVAAGLGSISERDEIEKSLRAIDERQVDLRTQLDQISAQINSTLNERSASAILLQDKKIELARFKQEYEDRQRDLLRAQTNISSLQEDAQKLLAEIASKRETLTQIENSIGQRESAIEDLRKQFEVLNVEFENALLKLNAQREIQFAAEMKYEKQNQLLQSLKNRQDQIKRELLDYQKRIEALETSLTSLQEENAQLIGQVDASKAELLTLESVCVDEGKALESVRGDLDTVGAQVQIQQKQLTDLENAVNTLQQTIHEAEMDLRGVSFERSRVIEEGVRVFGITPEELPSKVSEASNWPPVALKDGETLDSALERVTEQLTRLGQINFLAQEEFDRLQERITFLETQRDDILKAKADVESAIAKVNAQIEEAFNHTFAAVREKFREIFGLLFVGGEADLVLTEETDSVQRGVEIFAQPPGKKLQSIALLSQGEKALTAVSLLFAFFSINPAPVCILDEIDAPLDENNVIRFAKMLKQFSEKCQFMVITHNKRTMESAHALYGVTMEELGVSKLISVKLADVAATAV